MLLTTQKEAFRRDTNHRTRREMARRSVLRGKKRLRNVAKNLFFLGGFFLHYFEAELLIFLHEAKSIHKQRLSPPQIFCQKKEASLFTLHYSIRAHKHTHHIYSAFGQTTDS